MSKDYYKILGVSKDASDDEIKKEYRNLAHKHHPDKAGGDEAKFKEINEAYQVLKDSDKRKKYDQYGSSFEQMGGWGAATGGANWEDIMSQFRNQGAGSAGGFAFDLGDIFGEIFGGGGFSGARGRRASAGRDIQTTLEIDFNESVSGTERTVQLEKFDKCAHCKGNKAEPGTPIVDCSECGGRGHVTHTRQTILGVMQAQSVCRNCHGAGKFPKQNCSTCNGDGMERVKKKLDIKIPAGISDSETIRLAGEGELSEDAGHYGDLYVQIRVAEHYKFERTADDIHSIEPISFTQAALGAKIKVDTVTDKVELKIPPGTASETVFKLKKKGMPHLRSLGSGDHYIKVKIVVPDKLSRKTRRLLKELEKEQT